MQTYLSGKELSPFRQLLFVLNRLGRLLWQTNSKAFLITIFANILYSAVIIPTVLLDKLFLDTIIKSIGVSNLTPALNIIILVVIGRLIIAMFSGFMSRLAGNFDDILSREFGSKLDALMAKKYTSLDIPVLEDPEFQDRYQKIQQEGSSRAYRLVSSFADFPGSISGIISSLVIFVFFQPWIVVVAILTLTPQFLIDARLVRKRYQINEKLRTTNRLAGMLGYYLIRAKSYLEVRLLQVSDYLVKRLVSSQKTINDSWNSLNRERILSRTIGVIPQNLFSYSLDIYFAYQALIQRISIGTAQAYIRAISSFNTNLFNLVGSVIQFYENFLYVADLAWFLDLQPNTSLSGSKIFPEKSIHSIIFKNVWFKYPHSDNFVLKGVSFNISERENVALVGLNGTGKTTVIKLLAGFYKPSRGHVLIDNVEVTDFSKDSLWANLSVLFQDFESYDFSARESIAVGNITLVDDLPEIRKYASSADVDNWIMSLPKKYDTPLSPYYEKGVKPSSGQWQRIGIARSLIKNSQILVLDEPTSSVDQQAEEEIFNHVLKLGQEKIMIFISHRFNTVRRADKILVLEEGKISEQGTHDQLLSQNGTYARLFHLQAKSYQ